MKFGDTLGQRSVPQWAAYNVNYNDIKQLIKERTSTGLAVPVSIPNGSSNRWSALEEDLFIVLKDQHDNVSLFLKSKYGEIDRRLGYLEKQVRSVQKASQLSYNNPTLLSRKYHKVLQDAESIGQEIQNLTRFAGVQKTAFRKILKKYRKWTGSTSLQTRLENEVFSAGQLNLDYAHPLDRLVSQVAIVTELQQPQVQRPSLEATHRQISSISVQPSSTAAALTAAEQKGPIALDAALAITPYGKAAGFATYWIHPDNLDEAKALLLRHFHQVHRPSEISRESSSLSVTSGRSRTTSTSSRHDGTHIVYYDNLQRFVHDTTFNRPSKIALSGRWCGESEAAATLSNLAPWNPSGTIVDIKRKELLKALRRETVRHQSERRPSVTTDNVQRIQEYLSEHRDVKPIVEVHTTRSRYAGTANSSKVGTWAILDSDVVISPFRGDTPNSGHDNDEAEDESASGEAFPHTILEIRWEFGHIPEVVRAFDASHLAERVKDFSLESAAVYMVNKQLTQPAWKPLLENDIRKVPISTNPRSSRRRESVPASASAAGPSSNGSTSDGPTNSVFSAQNAISSATSVTSPNTSVQDLSSPLISKSSLSIPKGKKKKARIAAPSPPPRQSRYWNEFDDGEEDVNPQEAYTIYVNPDESLFPGSETVAKAFRAVYTSLEDTGSTISSIFSSKPKASVTRKLKANERSGLLKKNSSRSNSDEADTSDSDTTPINENRSPFGTFTPPKQPRAISTVPRSVSMSGASTYRPRQLLTPRQKALERTYFMFYTGLISLSYVLLFVSGVLLSTGRRKAHVEVDIAAAAGIVTAEVCAVLSIALLWMRRSPLSIVHRALVAVAIVGIILIGIGEIVALVDRPIKK